MPPDRGRASQACTACRKQKTRCYASGNGNGNRPCLRCERLQLSCSLDESSLANDDHGRHGAEDSVSYGDRIKSLERTVKSLEARLDMITPATIGPTASSAQLSPAEGSQFASSAVGASSTRPMFPPNPADDTPSSNLSSAPVFVIRDVAKEVGATPSEQENPEGRSHDIIDSGLIAAEDASELLALFLEHYGRWVVFKETTSQDALLSEVRKSPLLFCACCLIAIRHTTQEHASRLAPRLFQEAKSLLSMSLLVVPQSIEFFQAALIMSLWSTTIGQALLSIDSWLLSGFALQHCLSSDLFSPITTASRSAALSRAEVNRWFIWNHLCLVHLHYCVGTRRKAQLDREQIDMCRHILGSDHVTNFETRMVAEVNLYWIIYESCSRGAVDVPGTQERLEGWKQEWKFLFDQPRPQFIQMGFHFAQLLTYEQALKSRSAAVRESLLSEMVRLSAAILTLAMETTDLRTQHLSDHIYHIITFAAVTLCKLLHMYEDQLSRSHNIPELDQLVLTLVIWLNSIGLPCHIAHTLGDVVCSFHQKLRPNAQPTPVYQDPTPWLQDDLTFAFPDLLGTDLELFYSGDGGFFPDWEPFMQGPAT